MIQISSFVHLPAVTGLFGLVRKHNWWTGKSVSIKSFFCKYLKLKIQWTSNDFSFLLSKFSAPLDQANFKWLEESLRSKPCSSSRVA